MIIGVVPRVNLPLKVSLCVLLMDFGSAPIAMRRRAQAYLLKKDTASAIDVYVQYRSLLPMHRAWIDSSISLLTLPIEQSNIVNLGQPINTRGIVTGKQIGRAHV